MIISETEKKVLAGKAVAEYWRGILENKNPLLVEFCDAFIAALEGHTDPQLTGVPLDELEALMRLHGPRPNGYFNSGLAQYPPGS